MNKDGLTAPLPADDTIALLVRAARRAGIDVESDAILQVPDDPDRGSTVWHHLQALLVVMTGFTVAAIGMTTTVEVGAWISLMMLVLIGVSLPSIYRRPRSLRR